MNAFKPYWFLESPIDTEHKYYILMSYLANVKESFGKIGYEKNFKDLLCLKKDLESFDKKTEFSQKTVANMTETEKNTFYNLLDKNLDYIDEIEKILKNSIDTIDEFLESNKDIRERYDSLVDIESYCPSYNLWEQGYLIIRKTGDGYMKVFNWFFSIVKIGEKDNLALLMTEMLDPKCKTSKELRDIKKFLKSNIKDFSEQFDCILIADLTEDVDMEVGTEIGKEKSMDLILKKFRND